MLNSAKDEVHTPSVWWTDTIFVAAFRIGGIDWMLTPEEWAEPTLNRSKMLERHVLEQIAIKKRRALRMLANPIGSLAEVR